MTKTPFSKTALEKRDSVVVKFAGDSGDGMQLLGYQFTVNTALVGNDVTNFPDFPSEIRAPKGTLSGVSGFQLHFGSIKINTPGDDYDVLVAMNAAALKTNLNRLKPGAIIIVDSSGFSKKNLSLAAYDSNPLEDDSLELYQVYPVDVTKKTREALADLEMGMKMKDRCRNMFVLGLIYWIFSRKSDDTIAFFKSKFGSKPEVLEANIKALKAGEIFGEVSEIFATKYEVAPAAMPPGTYRGITGSHAIVLGLIAAAEKAGIGLFYGSYPITPASDILHGLSRYKNFGVKTFQAEDEIAAICAALGASYSGGLAVTGTSGPGMALKTEALGLAIMTELPLVIINVQRGGPSTGLPTKTEQSDLLQAMYGRNGEAPVPVVSCSSPSDSFEAAFEACRIALEHMTPVILLSDGYLANGAEPWKFPQSSELGEIKTKFIKATDVEEPFQPYQRDTNLARPWAIPGTPKLMHRIGGLEKEDVTGVATTDPDNHQKMVKTRAERVQRIANSIPEQKITLGKEKGKVLILGWGSTLGSITSAVIELIEEGYAVSHVHLRYIHPFPHNLEAILQRFEKVLIPEINNGQLIKIIREKFLIDAKGYNKIKGLPITKRELKEVIVEFYDQSGE
jgi:2-oxoglutarate/2-oxoacid ferredoxin oxidoreductase subunit alpha